MVLKELIIRSAGNSWVDFSYLQNKIDEFLREKKDDFSFEHKNILIFVHKEIQLNSSLRDVSFYSHSNWQYQVIEQLNRDSSRRKQADLISLIGKTSKTILEEVSISTNFGVFKDLFNRALDGLILFKDQFEYVKKYLNFESVKTEANHEGNDRPSSMQRLLLFLHQIVIKNLDTVKDTKWERELFTQEQLYISSFDIVQVILNIYSDEYIKKMNKILRVLIRYSCVFYLDFYSNLGNEPLKRILHRSFMNRLLKFQSEKVRSSEQETIFNMKIPFILFKIQAVLAEFGKIDLGPQLRGYAHSFKKVGLRPLLMIRTMKASSWTSTENCRRR